MKKNIAVTQNLPPAGVSLDLDNQWSYMKTHGDQGWHTFPSYLDHLIPEVLDILQTLGLKITFFIVGQDAALEKNRKVLELITRYGHETGNHSFHHEPWFSAHSKKEILTEIIETEQRIYEATGQIPIGFRSPGFSWGRNVLESLAERSYVYDASTLPTYIGPLARRYYLLKSKLPPEEKEKRKELFGGFRDGFRAIRPYVWQLPSGKDLLEIPVTTFPIVKVPIHFSYLLYLSRLSEKMMRFYFKSAVRLCRKTGAGLSFLLHPLDFLDKNDCPALSFFPAMSVERKQKKRIFFEIMDMISEYFNPVSMNSYARILQKNGLKSRELKE